MLTDLNDRLSRQIQLSIRPSLMFRFLPHLRQVFRSFEETLQASAAGGM